MAFGPELLVAVFVLVRYLLDGGPAQDGVVADKGGDVAVGDGVPDGRVDKVGEEGDAVLEVGVDYLHDSRRELHDADLGGLFHFGDGIQQTVGGHAGVGVDEEDVIAHADVAIGPGAAVFLEDVLQSSFVGLGFVVLGPVGVSGGLGELFFHLARDHEGIVHVGGLLELAASCEPVLAVAWTCNPPYAVVGIELNAGFPVLLGDQLETVVVDEHVG